MRGRSYALKDLNCSENANNTNKKKSHRPGTETTIQPPSPSPARALSSRCYYPGHSSAASVLLTQRNGPFACVLDANSVRLSRRITRHLRRAVSAMEAVYPPNYPELGDFHAALADANASFLEKRGQALPKKTRSQTDRFV